MNLLIEDRQPLIDARGNVPAVSIILPFHPIVAGKKELEYQLKRALEKVESGLMGHYSSDFAIPVLEKLRGMIRTLNYNTHKKSVAIFVSPLVEKVYYLDVPLEEKIVVDETFEIRDLVYSKKQEVQYLVLLLSADRSKMYLGHCSDFQLIKSNVPDHADAYVNDRGEKVGNFSDPVARRQLLLDKFLYHMDQGLSLILKAYPYPVFVMGAEKVLGHFRQITKNEKNIVGYVPGNYLEAGEDAIFTVLQPYLDNWQKVRQADLLNKVRAAAREKKLSAGLGEIWKASAGRKGRLLVVEKGFKCPARRAPDASLANQPFYIKDAVGDVMEKVLAGGGDVEFVEDGALQEYDHIALVRYY